MIDTRPRCGTPHLPILRRLAVACAALLALLSPAAAFAQGLIDNVNGMTLDERGRVVRFTGLVIGADGKVEELLSRRDRRPRDLRWQLDLEGKTVLPGMIDGHGHVMGLGFQLVQLDLSETNSLDEALAMIRDWAQRNTGDWIVGRGWNQEKWGLGRFPTAADLDAVAPGRAIYLERVDGHAAWANAKAMERAGITADTATPAGGRIEKNADGTPMGIFVDAAQSLFEGKLPEATPRERNAAFLAAQKALLADGITATADMGTSLDDWLLYRRMGDGGLLRMRIMSYAMGVDTALRVGGSGPTDWLYGDRLRMGGIKLYLDGALGSRGAWLKSDYADAAGETGLRFVSDTQLRNLMSRATMDNFQVAVHAIGDAANAQVLDAIAELADSYPDRDARWRVEHAQIVDPADLPRFGEHGTIASMQPVHETSDRLMAEARLGEARLAGAYAWRSMLAAGATLSFGSDFPVESPNPFAGWAVGFTRQDADMQPFGGWRPEEALTREQAWAAFTTGAAYAGFAEARFGRLAPGLWADFIVVDRDPLLASPSALRETRVLQTWVAGNRVFEREGD